jgi:hypothetical protein
VCTFGIDELRQQSSEILLLWRNAEEHAFRAHVPVEALHVGDSEPEFDFSRRILVGSRVQGESGFTRREFTLAGRFKPKLETECVTVELYRFVHVRDELDHISKLCSFHFDSLH